MVKDVSNLMTSNKTDEAHIAVADFFLTNVRRTIIVSNAVERQLVSIHPRPTGSPEPMTSFTKPWDGSTKPNVGSRKPHTGSTTKPSPTPKTAPVKRNTDIIEDESIDLFEPILATRD